MSRTDARATRATRLLAATALAMLAAACSPNVEALAPDSTAPRGPRFVPEVVDIRADSGSGLSLAAAPDGTPHASYLRLDEEVAIPLQPVPEDPTALPAVMVATRLEGLWVRQVVFQEREEPAEGEEASGPDKLTGLDPATDSTDIALDGSGARHVVWSVGNGAVQYATDAGGGFPSGEADEAEIVAEGSGLSGAAVAVAGDGTPWVSFYEGGQVRAATRAGDTWTVEEVAQTTGPTAGEAAPPAAGQRTDIAAGPDGPIVVYGDGDATMVATRDDAGAWTTEEADGQGGFGASIALDGDGNPHLAYATSGGAVRHAHRAGASWTTSVVDDGAGTVEDGGPSIALTGDGTHWVVYVRASGDSTEIWVANNADGDFASQRMPDGIGGRLPVVAAGTDAPVAAWYDAGTTSVLIAPHTNRAPPIAHPSPPAGTGGPTASPTASPTDGGTLPCEPSGTELQITAPAGATTDGFDTDCLAAPAGEAFTVAFTNQEEGVPHNWVAYTDDSGSERLGGAEGPADTITTGTATYDLDPLDAGQYFYRCDIHPATMTGTLVVA